MHLCVHTYSCVHVYMHVYTTISQTVNNRVSRIHRGNRAGDLYSCVSRWFTFQQGFRAHLPYTSPIKPLSLALTQLILTRASYLVNVAIILGVLQLTCADAFAASAPPSLRTRGAIAPTNTLGVPSVAAQSVFVCLCCVNVCVCVFVRVCVHLHVRVCVWPSASACVLRFSCLCSFTLSASVSLCVFPLLALSRAHARSL